MKARFSVIALLLASFGLAYSLTAVAQIEEVVVTAQKTEQSSQDIPIALNAFSGNFIENSGAADISDLSSFSPGFEVSDTSSGQPNLFIRGVGTNDFGAGSDPAVGVYLDGVYIGRPGTALLNLMDIQRVEVLKGPQGTLFGRNAAAGAISIITNKPHEEKEGSFSTMIGNYGQRQAKLMYNAPITDNFFFRGNFQTNARDGYIDNANGDELGEQEEYSGRTSFLYAGDLTEMILSLDFDKISNDGASRISNVAAFGGGDPYGEASHDEDEYETRDAWGASLTVTHDFESVTFTSISAYRFFSAELWNDEDGGDSFANYFATLNDEKSHYYSQEFRLNSAEDSNIRWFVGGSFSYEDIEQTSVAQFTTNSITSVLADQVSQLLGGIPVTQTAALTATHAQALLSGATFNLFQSDWGQFFRDDISNTGKYESYAVYGEVTFPISERVDLTLGGRYTEDKKEFSWYNAFNSFDFSVVYPDLAVPAIEDEDSWSAFNMRASLQFFVNDDVLLFGTVSQGYKAGGFNSQTPGSASFDPEEILNIEMGVKSSFLDNTLRFNASIFQYYYDDLQVNSIETAPGALFPSVQVLNASEAEGRGLEFELIWLPTDGLTLTANGAIQDTEITAWDATSDSREGNELPRAPKETLSLGMDYEWLLDSGSSVTWHVDGTYTAGHYFNTENTDLESIGGVTVANTRLTYLSANEEWQISGFVNNVTDKEYYIDRGGLGKEVLSPITQRALPRTYGVEFKYNF